MFSNRHDETSLRTEHNMTCPKTDLPTQTQSQSKETTISKLISGTRGLVVPQCFRCSARCHNPAPQLSCAMSPLFCSTCNGARKVSPEESVDVVFANCQPVCIHMDRPRNVCTLSWSSARTNQSQTRMSSWCTENACAK